MLVSMPMRKRPVKTRPTPPTREVREKLDPEHREADFLRDLDRVATNRADEKLERASRRGRASTKK